MDFKSKSKFSFLIDPGKGQGQNETEEPTYFQKLQQYYDLKKKYEKLNKKDATIQTISEMNISRSEKAKMYSNKTFKCVECKEKCGTVFIESKESLKAYCGNKGKRENKCMLDITISRIPVAELYSELEKSMTELNSIKQKIIMTKLDFLFNYIPEETALEQFESSKEKLSSGQEKFNECIMLYDEVIKTNPDIDEKTVELYKAINQYKESIDLLKKTGNKVHIKDALEIYMQIKDLKEIDLPGKIREMTYMDNDIEEDITTGLNKLIQNKYAIRSMELIYN